MPKRTDARAARDQAIRAARAAYNETMRQAWGARDQAIRAALAAYDESEKKAQADYNKAKEVPNAKKN